MKGANCASNDTIFQLDYNLFMTTKSRYEQLKSEVNAHNYRYHVLDAPIISDLEYDKLLNELKRIEAEPADRFG